MGPADGGSPPSSSAARGCSAERGSVVGALIGSLIMGMLTNAPDPTGPLVVGADDAQGRPCCCSRSRSRCASRGGAAQMTALVRLEHVRKEFGAVVATRGRDARRRARRDRRASRRQRGGQVDGRELQSPASSRRPRGRSCSGPARAVLEPLDARNQGSRPSSRTSPSRNAQPVYMNMFPRPRAQ